MKKDNDCNLELLQDVVLETKESAKTVREAIAFFSGFIAFTIKEGAFESVIVPHFGKFQPKIKEIQWRMQSKGESKGGPINKEHNGTI